MGWTFCLSHFEKSQLVADRIKGFSGTGSAGDQVSVVFSDYSVSGNQLWKVGIHTNLKTGEVHKFIALDLLQKMDENWGYKDMEESMGPYFYNCPLKFLKMVPVVNQEWRNDVIKYHAEKKAKANIKLTLGKTYKIVGRSIPQVVLVSVSPLRGSYMGVTYRLMKKMIGEEV